MKLLHYLLSLTVYSVSGFVPSQQSAIQNRLTLAVSSSSCDDDMINIGDTRRDFVTQTLATALTAATASTSGMGIFTPSPANAVRGADKVNSMLKA
jgi:hypothetical protein